jgi:alkylation response protein AidB-like acyl-CoA dehydrogenase
MVATVPGIDFEEKLRLAREIGLRARNRRRKYDDDASFPEENFAEIRAAGLHTMGVPVEYGGLGLWQRDSFIPYYKILEALAEGDSSTSQLVQIQTHASGIIAALGSPEQKAYYMAKVVDEGALVASVGSEAHLKEKGPEVYKSELRRGEDGKLHLSTRKAFASLAPAAAYWLLWVAVEGEGGFADRLTFACVPNGTPGTRLVDDWDTMGMRSTVSQSIEIKDLVVPDEWIIGAPGDWMTKDPRTFTLAYTANHIGTAQGAVNFAIDYIKEREQLQKDAVTMTAIGDMQCQLFSVRQALYAVAEEWERGVDLDKAELDSMRVLHVAKRVALDVTGRLFDLLGARVTFRIYPLEQALRDVRTFTLHFRDYAYMQIVAGADLGKPFAAKGFRSGSSPGQSHLHTGNLDAVG